MIRYITTKNQANLYWFSICWMWKSSYTYFRKVNGI